MNETCQELCSIHSNENETNHHQVKKVIDCRIDRYNIYYKVKWEPTWVSALHLIGHENLVDQYWTTAKQGVKPQQHSRSSLQSSVRSEDTLLGTELRKKNTNLVNVLPREQKQQASHMTNKEVNIDETCDVYQNPIVTVRSCSSASNEHPIIPDDGSCKDELEAPKHRELYAFSIAKEHDMDEKEVRE